MVRLFAFFIHGCQYGKLVGGAERRFLEVSKRLKDLGIEVYTLELEPSLERTWINAGYRSLEVTPSFPNILAMLIKLTLIGLHFCNKHKPDLIYVASHHSPENVIPGYFVSRLVQKPLAIVFHHLTRVEKLPIHTLLKVRLEKGSNLASAITRICLEFLKRQIFSRAEVCIAVSRATARDLTQYFGVRRCIVVGNGIDISQYETCRPNQKCYDAVFLGKIHPTKGVKTLIKTWKIVATELPSAKLVIIGSGEKSLVESYKAVIKELGLNHNILMAGFVSNERVKSFLKLSKTFILPSKFEGFGIAVAEAMACGLPCVISDLPALRENFGDVSIFIKPDDAEGFAEAVISLLKDERKRRALGAKGREHVKKFCWDKVVKKELDAIRNLLP